MPGIYGIKGDTEKAELLNKTMLYNSTYNTKKIKPNESTFLGTSFYKNESYDIFENKEYVVGFDGYFYTSDSKVSMSVEKIYELYIDFGNTFIEKMDGIFNIFIYNKNEDKLNLFNDWAGNCYLFYYWDGKNFIFSSELKSILKIIKSKSINVKGVLQQFLFGHCLFDNTLVNEIKILEPASIVEIQGNNLNISNYFDLKNHLIIKNENNLNSYIEKLYSLFDTTTKKFMHIDSISLPMTGGLDSRLLLHFMMKYNYAFKDIYTVGNDKVEDVKIAKSICNHFNLNHRVFEFKYDDLHDSFEEGYEYHDGFLSSIFNNIEKQKTILKNDCYYMIQYLYNDFVFGEKFAYKNRYLKKSAVNHVIIQKIIYSYLKSDVSFVRTLFDNPSTIDSIFEELYNYLKPAHNLPAHSIVDYFAWYQHCRHWINIGNSTSRSARYIRRLVPSQDKDIILFAFRLPYKYRQWRFLLRKTIQKKCPELVIFPREGTGISLKRNNYLQIIARAFRKYIKKDIYAPDTNNMYKYFFTNVVDDKIYSLLFSGNSRTDSLMDPKLKNEIFENIKNGKNQSLDLHNIINLEIFLRKHF
jgi:asparagine synthase (glutamine-hydrolysing)